MAEKKGRRKKATPARARKAGEGGAKRAPQKERAKASGGQVKSASGVARPIGAGTDYQDADGWLRTLAKDPARASEPVSALENAVVLSRSLGLPMSDTPRRVIALLSAWPQHPEGPRADPTPLLELGDVWRAAGDRFKEPVHEPLCRRARRVLTLVRLHAAVRAGMSVEDAGSIEVLTTEEAAFAAGYASAERFREDLRAGRVPDMRLPHRGGRTVEVCCARRYRRAVDELLARRETPKPRGRTRGK